LYLGNFQARIYGRLMAYRRKQRRCLFSFDYSLPIMM
jgi:hypothetical protein